MMTRAYRSQAGALIALVLGACSPAEDSARPDSINFSSRPVVASAAPSPGSCVLAELWSPCLLRKALENAGLAPQEQDSVHYPFVHAGGRRWQLGRAELQTFVFPSVEALRADLAAIDTATGQPRSGRDRVEWSAVPTFIVNRNLLGILIGGSERQGERIHNALEAGVLTTKPRP